MCLSSITKFIVSHASREDATNPPTSCWPTWNLGRVTLGNRRVTSVNISRRCRQGVRETRTL